jgi:hypothetical protein
MATSTSSPEPTPGSSAAIPSYESVPTADVGVAGGWIGLSGLAAAGMALGAAAAFTVNTPVAIVAGVCAGAGTLLTTVLAKRKLLIEGQDLVQRGFLGEKRIRFSDIDDVRFALAQHTVDVASTLQVRGAGEKISFNLFSAERAAAIGRYVLQQRAPDMVKDISARLRRGETIMWGKLVLNQSGMTLKGKQVAWTEVARIDRAPNFFRVFPVDRPNGVLKLNGRHMNIPLLATLVTQMSGGVTERRKGGEHVEGFADRHHQLGAVVCGRARRPGVEKALLAATVATAAGAAAAMVGLGLSVGVGVGLAALVPLGLWQFRKRQSMAIYDRGIIGGNGTELSFNDITSITRQVVDRYYNGAYIGRTTTVKVRGTGGQSIGFGGGGEENEGLADALIQRLVPKLTERLWHDLQRGGELKVGKIVATRDGLSRGKVLVRWPDIGAVDVQGGDLHVWAAAVGKPLMSVSMGEPNALVLVEMIQAMVNGQVPGKIADAVVETGEQQDHGQEHEQEYAS